MDTIIEINWFLVLNNFFIYEKILMGIRVSQKMPCGLALKLKKNVKNANAVRQQMKEYEYIKIISLLQIMI